MRNEHSLPLNVVLQENGCCMFGQLVKFKHSITAGGSNCLKFFVYQAGFLATIRPIEMNGQHTHRSIAARSLAIWLVIIVAETMHGIARAVMLVPAVGEFRSNQIGVFSGSVIILVIALVSAKWLGASSTAELLLVGLLWTALTLAFEIIFGRAVLGLSWERLLADYNLTAGGLLPLGLIVLAGSPWIAAKARGII